MSLILKGCEVNYQVCSTHLYLHNIISSLSHVESGELFRLWARIIHWTVSLVKSSKTKCIIMRNPRLVVSRYLLGPILLETIWFWLLRMYQAVLFHQKPQTANKLELNTFSNLLVTGYVFFFMPDPTDLFGLNFWSGHSDVVTAHKESLRAPVQLYSGLILLCEIELLLIFWYKKD